MPVIGYITGTEIFSVVSVEYIFYCSQMYLSSNLHMSSLNALGHSRTPHRGFFFLMPISDLADGRQYGLFLSPKSLYVRS